MGKRYRIGRIWALIFLIGLLTVSVTTLYAASPYPTKPVQIIVPYAPGGGQDSFTRVVANVIKQYLGQPLVVVNREGGGATIGTYEVAKAKPDGYTILSEFAGPMVHAPLTRSVKYSPDDFEAVIQLTATAEIIVGGPTSPVSSWKELVEYAKAHPRELKITVSGLMEGAHLFAEEAFSVDGLKIVPVPTVGSAQSMASVLGGHVPLAATSAAKTLDHIRNGTLKPIILSAPMTELPKIPTLKDIGRNERLVWRGIFVPKGTPQEIILKLEDAFYRALTDPKVEKLTKDLGEPAVPLRSAEFKKAVQAEFKANKILVEKLAPKTESK